MTTSDDYVAPLRDPVYLPWPVVMDFADALDRQGYTQLAREARQRVWLEAERRFHNDGVVR